MLSSHSLQICNLPPPYAPVDPKAATTSSSKSLENGGSRKEEAPENPKSAPDDDTQAGILKKGGLSSKPKHSAKNMADTPADEEASGGRNGTGGMPKRESSVKKQNSGNLKKVRAGKESRDLHVVPSATSC